MRWRGARGWRDLGTAAGGDACRRVYVMRDEEKGNCGWVRATGQNSLGLWRLHHPMLVHPQTPPTNPCCPPSFPSPPPRRRTPPPTHVPPQALSPLAAPLPEAPPLLTAICSDILIALLSSSRQGLRAATACHSCGPRSSCWGASSQLTTYSTTDTTPGGGGDEKGGAGRLRGPSAHAGTGRPARHANECTCRGACLRRVLGQEFQPV